MFAAEWEFWNSPIALGGLSALLIASVILMLTRLWRVPEESSLIRAWDLCLKCLGEGHTPLSAVEFVAEWGPADLKPLFREAATQVHAGVPLREALEPILRLQPLARLELIRSILVAAEQKPEAAAWGAALIESRREATRQCQQDLEWIIRGARLWVFGLVWTGLLGTSILIIAIPQYSHALVETPIGRGVLAVLMALELAGVIWAGTLLRMQRRMSETLADL